MCVAVAGGLIDRDEELFSAGTIVIWPLDLPAPLFQEMLRLFETSIDASLPCGVMVIVGCRRMQVMTLGGEPGQHVGQAFGAEALGRFQACHAELGNVVRLEFGSIEQATQDIDFTAVEFQAKGSCGLTR
jgi:hypothetical protein